MARKNPLDLLNPTPTPIVDEALASVTGIEEGALEAAANLLLAQFTPAVRGFAEEVADIVLKIPRWQLVCGSVLAQHEGGSLPAPSIDPAWIHETSETGMRECAFCHETFTPFKAFQRYCSNVCGNAARREERDAIRG